MQRRKPTVWTVAMTTEPCFLSFSSQGSFTPLAPFSTALCGHRTKPLSSSPPEGDTHLVESPAVLHTERHVLHSVSMSCEVGPQLLVAWQQSRLEHKDHLQPREGEGICCGVLTEGCLTSFCRMAWETMFLSFVSSPR